MAEAPLAAEDRIGFVGLGNMGVPMVRRLLSGGFQVQGYDVNPEQGAALEGEAGYTRVGSIEQLVTGARMLILMVPNSAIVEAVLLGSGMLDAVREHAPECIVVDMSSSKPAETVRMGEEAASRNVRFIDAPVSGGVPGATEGTLSVMVGGPAELDAIVRPALDRIGSNVVHAGAIGAGHALKAINNLLSGASFIASAEAMVIGQKFGLDPQVMSDAINGSSGRSWSTMLKWPRYVIPRQFNSGFTLGLHLKDIRIATELADQLGVPAP
ncbi:MAG: NAD(P)-dependent oxidoreductase, partial [Leucobacter sp.]|nr:NAD(P)-dependent oxidoreductase [Leucobacter sp.]